MMKEDPKKMALFIFGKGNRPEMRKKPLNEMGDEHDASIAYESAADEILEAIESKNKGLLIEALKSFHELCMSEPSDDNDMEGA